MKPGSPLQPPLRATRIALAACALWGAVGAAQAASLTAFAGVVGGPGNGNINAGCTTSGPPSDVAFFSGLGPGFQVLGGNAACGYSGGWSTVTSTGSNATLTHSASLPPTRLGVNVGGFFDGTSSAHANYGVLGAAAYGHQSAAGYDPTAIAVSSAAATFSDTLTATVSNSYTQVSSAGFVSYRFTIDGHLSTTTTPASFFGGEALTGLNIQNNGGPIYNDLIAYAHSGDIGRVSGIAGRQPGWVTGLGSVSGGSSFESERFAIDLTQPWDVKVGLISTVYARGDNEFSSTARLVGIDLFDSQGNPITQFGLSAASGTDYASLVPEPPETVLILAGVLVLLAWQRRRPGDGPR